MKSYFLTAAVERFGAEGRVAVGRVKGPDRDGLYSASIRVTTPKAIIHLTAWADRWGICFVTDRTEPLNGLPLFETI